MNELLNRFMTMLRPESAQQVATSPLTVPQAGMLNRLLGLATTQAQGAMQAAPEQLARSRQMLADWQPGQEVSPELMNQFMNLAMMGSTGIAKAGKWSLPMNVEDVTKLPIPKEFGGVKTEEYLFHGGIKGKLNPKSTQKYLQGAEDVGVVPTSFSKSPQEALEYTTIAGGDMVAIPKSALNIYKGGNETLNKAVMSNNIKVLKDAGFDGVDLQAIVPGGYREVVVWGLDKAADKALYAPVRVKENEISIIQPLKSLLE